MSAEKSTTLLRLKRNCLMPIPWQENRHLLGYLDSRKFCALCQKCTTCFISTGWSPEEMHIQCTVIKLARNRYFPKQEKVYKNRITDTPFTQIQTNSWTDKNLHVSTLRSHGTSGTGRIFECLNVLKKAGERFDRHGSNMRTDRVWFCTVSAVKAYNPVMFLVAMVVVKQISCKVAIFLCKVSFHSV